MSKYINFQKYLLNLYITPTCANLLKYKPLFSQLKNLSQPKVNRM